MRNIFFSNFPEAVRKREREREKLGGIWRHMINLVYGVCRSPLQPFREELGHSKYIYRKGVSPEGGDDWQVMERYYWILVILAADLCVFFKQIVELAHLKKVTDSKRLL